MRFARQSVAALSTVLLLQLSLGGSGTLCALRHASAHGGAEPSMEGMTGMARDTDAAAADHGSTVTEQAGPASQDAESGCPSKGESEPCHGPWAPGTCASMSSCAWSQGVPFEPTLASADNDSGAAGAEPLMLHTGPAFAPEIPPPRA